MMWDDRSAEQFEQIVGTGHLLTRKVYPVTYSYMQPPMPRQILMLWSCRLTRRKFAHRRWLATAISRNYPRRGPNLSGGAIPSAARTSSFQRMNGSSR